MKWRRRKPEINFSALLGLCCLCACSGPSERAVVVYTSQDQIYAEPIFQSFTRESGIVVRAVYDNEAIKTVGLVNRLLLEKWRPRCDLFWNNEEFRTRQLAAQNLFQPENGWAKIGYRSRRIAFNTRLIQASQVPIRFSELTNRVWRHRVALAYPLFGTTATHFLALKQSWGDQAWIEWCRALAANQPFLVDGNSVVIKLVGAGEAIIGLTDSDDVAAGKMEGLPVDAKPLAEESLLIPNTVARVRDAPHPAEAAVLFRYLQRTDVVQQLVGARALEGADPSQIGVRTLAPDFETALKDLDHATAMLKEIFLR